jgi:peptide/nickel transport system substrate-binding protein
MLRARGGPSAAHAEVAVKTRAWMIAGVLAGALLAGCGTGRGGRGPFVDRHPLPADTLTESMREPGGYGGRFVIGVTAPPKTFNTLMSNEQSSNDVCNQLFVSLTDIDNITQADVPVIAKSWEWRDDGRTVVFHLRRGLCFSDGHPLTAEDVKFSFDVAMDDSLPTVAKDGLTDTDPVTGEDRKFTYSAPDSFTFTVTSPRPYSMMLSATGAVRIMPKHVLEKPWREGRFGSSYGVDTPAASLVSSGPWRLSEYVPDQKVVLERNPWWFGVDARGRRLPYLDELVFLVVKDQNAAALKFRAGEIDGIDNVRPEDYRGYEAAQQQEHFVLYDVGPSLNTNFLWFNLNPARRDTGGVKAGQPAVGAVKYAWFRNPAFRRAVSMAIDRKALVAGPFRGYALENWGLLTAGNVAWYDTSLRGAAYDPAGARKLLAGLGWRDRDGDGVLEDENGHTVAFSIMTNSDNNVRKDMLTLVCDDLAKVGVHATPAPVEMSTLVTHTRSDFQYDACLLGLGAAVPPDPGMYPNVIKSSGLSHYWHIRQDKPGTPEEKKLDALFDGIVYSTDTPARRRAYHEIGTILNEQAWIIWLPTQLVKLPVRARFGNVQPAIIPHRLLWNSDRVFVKSGGS